MLRKNKIIIEGTTKISFESKKYLELCKTSGLKRTTK